MKSFARVAVSAAMLAFIPAAWADKFDSCPDPEAARKYVKVCMQESPYNTKETCEEIALRKFCSGN
ncbi:MAG: hypothetical protein PVH25_04150 [Burkholderiales bacterium]